MLFLDSLDDNQRQGGDISIQRQRTAFELVPTSPRAWFPRGGVKLGVLSESQRANLDKLLGELLSEDGVEKCRLAIGRRGTCWFREDVSRRP